MTNEKIAAIKRMNIDTFHFWTIVLQTNNPIKF